MKTSGRGSLMSGSDDLRTVLAIWLVLALTGCAGSTAGSPPGIPHAEKVLLKEYDYMHISVTSGDTETPVTDEVKQRIAGLVKDKLTGENGHFRGFLSQCGPEKAIETRIHLTHYDSGDAFFRFLFFGDGGILIKGDVILIDCGTGRQLASYHLQKQFAFGGVYGGATTIEDVEDGFADDVAGVFMEEKP